jgi:threonylcarbamoyladenosine tRNA methylthiotransferase MtaB
MSLGVYLESIGCKLNQCERDMLAQRFSEAGYVVVSRAQDADICVVNTCAVTHVAARKSRHRFRALQRINPEAHLVATGCYAGMAENGLQVDLIVSNDRKPDLVSLVDAECGAWGLLDGGTRQPRLEEGAAEIGTANVLCPRTRPMVKIQDGCDNACTYCVIRVLRGRQRSRPRTEIVARVAELARAGYHEVVLTGVHVGAYGRDIGDDLVGLVKAILAQSSPERLRLSSIEPWDLSPDFFELWQDPRLCRHVHLPLQSGCDATLERMNRHYTTAEFADMVCQARAAIPGLALTTDVIVGFPGETEREFAASAAFVEQVGFARVHVFPYSARPGTEAASMPAQVDPQVRQQRARLVSQIARHSSRVFRRRLVGQTCPVLWETQRADGRWSGLTDRYVRVFAESSQNLANTLRPARLVGLDRGGMCGRLLDQEVDGPAAECGEECHGSREAD